MKYKMILWDFDGTLAYTGKDVWDSLQYAAKKCGGELPEAFIKEDSNLGKTVEEVFRQIIPAPEKEQYETFDAMVRVHYRMFNEFKYTHLYPGIHELLLQTREAGVSHYIVTMKPREALERILMKKGWGNFFDGWVSPDSFPGTERTKSEMIGYVMKSSHLEESQYIYIGDTWSDVQAAHENKIRCIGVTYGDGDAGRLCAYKPEYCADNVSEIQKILSKGV